MTAPAWAPSFDDIDIDIDDGQIAFGNRVNGDLILKSNRFVRGQPSMYLGPEEIADRIRCHVAARNHGLIVKALELDHAITLVGPPGCGRESTAIAAIGQIRPGIRIRRFSLDVEDTEEISANGCGYLIRAADTDPRRLASCVEAVRGSGGYLVVIAEPGNEWTSAEAALSPITVEPPHPVEVYRRRLVVRGLGEWARWNEAPELLDGARPADARWLADLVERIAPGAGSLTASQEEVREAYRGWKNELCGWFEAHPEPHERALLVAAAALAPADETNVYTVAASLARRLDVTMSGLAWCPVTRLRELLRADDENGRIVFRRYGFARSALRHVLTDFPLARPEVFAWLAALPTDVAVPSELSEPLAEAFVDLAAELGQAGLIIETARAWGADGLADLAFTALSRTCLHPRVGGKVRRALYEWSYNRGTPATLKLVIARVCGPLGQTYPSLALTRLKHLATRGNRQVLGEVISATRELAASGHHAEVLRAALAWCAESSGERLSPRARERRRYAGAVLFLDLAQPVTTSGLPYLLDIGRVGPMGFEPGWRAALDSAVVFGTGDVPVEEVVPHWLDAALRNPHVRPGIVQVFVTAATSSITAAVRYGTTQARRDPTTAELMIDMVLSWAEVDRADRVRQAINEGIVIPLTRPWWLRLVRLVLMRLRTGAARRRA